MEGMDIEIICFFIRFVSFQDPELQHQKICRFLSADISKKIMNQSVFKAMKFTMRGCVMTTKGLLSTQGDIQGEFDNWINILYLL